MVEINTNTFRKCLSFIHQPGRFGQQRSPIQTSKDAAGISCPSNFVDRLCMKSLASSSVDTAKICHCRVRSHLFFSTPPRGHDEY